MDVFHSSIHNHCFKNLVFILFIIICNATDDRLIGGSCDCPQVLRPVCGTDNVSYDNLCFLRCAQEKNRDLLFFYNGTCCPDTDCKSYPERPLCDNFGKTHSNYCNFEKFKCIMEKSMGLTLEKLFDGECVQKNCTRECSNIYNPVCDKNGAIYRNKCLFEKRKCQLAVIKQNIELSENITSCLSLKNIPHKAAGVESYTFYSSYVDEQTSEKQELEPYVDQISNKPDEHINKTTIYNSTDLIDDKVKSRDAPSTQSNAINPICTVSDCEKSWDPVCDTRNRTHKNICHFKYYTCMINQIDGSTVDIAHTGQCHQRKTTCANCPKDEKSIQICDNKNMTHPNLCSFIKFNCNARSQNEEERVLVHIKPCHSRSPQFELQDEVCPATCNKTLKPVCDEANNTHQNLCHFQQYNCNMRKLGIRSPYLRYLRPCHKHKNIDKAVENIALKAEVSDININNILPKTLDRSEKTTFIVSSIDTSTRNEVVTTTELTISSEEGSSTTEILETTTTKQEDISSTTETDTPLFDCPTPNCPIDGQPVCDSKGNLHGNLCEFTYYRCLAARRGEQLQIASEDNCVSTEACQMPCTDEKHPICASDFSTYDNLCQFRKQKCLDQELEVLFKGKCNECLDSPCALPAFDSPDDSFVCLEDDTTKSLCEYQMLSCILERGYGVNLTIQYIGKCCPRVETCDDNKSPNPVCASNGVTYLTECEFKIENCKLEKLDLPLLTIVSNGVCERITPFSQIDEELESRPSIDMDVEFKRAFQDSESLNCSMECDKSYDPLCGTDGVTYTNACSFQKEICDNENSTIKVAYSGMCCENNCPDEFSPVCDSKGTTHKNICHFGYKRCTAERTSGDVLTIDKFEICNVTKECNMTCPKTYNPLCTTNGQSIINTCELEKINCLIRNDIVDGDILEKDYDGECCVDENCDHSKFSPVCDSIGVTHANECLMRRHVCIHKRKHKKDVTIAYKGQCCDQPCGNEKIPVCDGNQTHDNICKFRVAQCEAERNNTSLQIAYQGECCEIPKGECENSGPVCDSDGQTHANNCIFQKNKCVAKQISNKTLNVIHTGECCELSSCPVFGEPICDSMGRTHDSLCHFHNAKCIYDKIHSNNSTLQLDYEGKCCDSACTEELSITCDQNGKVYRNTCYFNLKACETWKRSQELLIVAPCPLLQS